MMTLRDLIESDKNEIVERWLARGFEVYPADARKFFQKKNNRFANPVGDTLRRGILAFVDGLIVDEPPEALCLHLEEIVQIRSVQQMPPSEALGFVMLLKEIVREISTKGKKSPPDLEKTLAGLASRIDATSLQLFDLYLKYRERVFDIRVNDVKRQVSHLLKRTSFFINDIDQNSSPDGDSGEMKK